MLPGQKQPTANVAYGSLSGFQATFKGACRDPENSQHTLPKKYLSPV
jgi:hypothetical protein